MATFAVIENNIVENVIVADTLTIAEQATQKKCVEYTEENPIGIGWIYNGSTFEAPAVVEETK